MNSASSERVTNVSEESFFTWNDLVLAAKSSKDCTLNHFWQIFGLLRNFSIVQTFTCFNRHWEDSILGEQSGHWHILQFARIPLFPKILSLKSFGNSFGNSCMEFVSLHYVCGESHLDINVEIFQCFMTCSTFFWKNILWRTEKCVF